MNLNNDIRLVSIIREVLDLIGDDYIFQYIEMPILNAAATFRFNPPSPISNAAFIRIIGDFTYHIYKHGLRLTRRLSETQSRLEAISILEQNYRKPKSHGYAAAFLDVRDPNSPGMDFVLSELTDHILSMEKTQYMSCIFETHIKALDWQSKCNLTNILIKLNHAFFPSSIHDCPPAQLAHLLPELILIVAAADSKINKLKSANMLNVKN